MKKNLLLITLLLLTFAVGKMEAQTHLNFSSNIADYAHKDNTVIETVTMTTGVTSIGDGAFGDCTSLTGVDFGSASASIGDFAFYGCSQLQTVSNMQNVTNIGQQAFSDCSQLQNVNLQSVTSIEVDAFRNCSNLKTITFGSALETIDNTAFAGSGIEIITLPASLTSMGEWVFSDCHQLGHIVMQGDAPTGVVVNTFNATGGNVGGCKVKVPAAYAANYAGWNSYPAVTIYSYDVSFMNDGVAYDVRRYVAVGGKVSAPAAPTKAGYVFSHWANGGSEWNFSNTVTADMTLTAVYNQLHTQTINLPTGFSFESGSVASMQAEATKTFSFSFKAPAGRHFRDVKVNGGATLTPSSGIYTYTSSPITGTNTFTVSAEEYHIITLNTLPTGITTTTSATTNITAGGTYTLPLTAAAGRHFRNITVSNSSGTGASWPFFENGETRTYTINPVAADATISVSADECYIVRFDANGGSAVKNDTVNINTACPEPTAPTRADYGFNGWDTALNGNTKWNFSNNITGDMTLYAKWNPVITLDTPLPAHLTTSTKIKDTIAYDGTYTLTLVTDADYNYYDITIGNGTIDSTWAFWSGGADIVFKMNNVTTPSTITVTAHSCLKEIADYPVINVGTHCWTAENLTTGAGFPYFHAMYPDTDVNKATYGLLFDFAAAQTACPSGWSLPDATAVAELISIYSSPDAKATTGEWFYGDVNNSSGFTALPAGMYNALNGRYELLRGDAFFWTSAGEVIHLSCGCGDINTEVVHSANRYSVRCVKKCE